MAIEKLEPISSQELRPQISQHLRRVALAYSSLYIGGKFIQCPYYMNKDSLYEGTPYYKYVNNGGKMLPQEIERFTEIRALEQGIDLTNLKHNEVRDFVFEIGAGIDCSGYVYNLSKCAYENVASDAFEDHIVKPGSSIHPSVNRISAQDLTHLQNCQNVKSLFDIKPADIITVSNSRHVISIIDVIDDEIICAHATNVIEKWGASLFIITVTDPHGNIYDQVWHETDWINRPYVEGVKKRLHPNDGIKRLLAFKSLYELPKNRSAG